MNGKLKWLKFVAWSILGVSLFLNWAGFDFSQMRFGDSENGRVLFSSDVWTVDESVDQAAGEIIGCLQESPLSLFPRFTSDIRKNYGEASFEESLEESDTKIISAEQISSPTLLSDDWAEFVVRLHLQEGESVDFRVILKKEAGLWRIFGTQEIV